MSKFGYKVNFFDYAFGLLNPLHPLFYPFEHLIIREVGMGFKLDQAGLLLPIVEHYDVIVCTGDSAGLPFLFFKYLGLVKKPIILLSSGLVGSLRLKSDSWVARFYKRIFTAVDRLTVYSEVEMDFYRRFLSVSKEKISYIPYCTDWNFFSQKTKNKPTFISAIGTDSGRDYQTFFQAVKDIPEKIIVACQPKNVYGLTIPANVTCKFLVSPREIRDILHCSKVVVVPCKERRRSAGQMVVLEAASAGRPIVASSILGITGAFAFKNKKHLLYVPPENPKKLRESILYLLKYTKFAENLGRTASILVHQNYTTRHLALNITNLIKKI